MLKSIFFYIVKLFPPEFSNILVINLLKIDPFPKKKIKINKNLQINLFGHKLSNPLGLAAGFDKNGEALSGLLKLNFSFIEVGTITPLAQQGNKKPRVYRIKKEKSIINKLGFPNEGVDKLVKRLSLIRKSHPLGSEPIIGVNIGCNKTSQNPIEDFIICLRKVYGVADYLTINISSPNTPGLRDFQKKKNLDMLLRKIDAVRLSMQKKFKRRIPLVVKISPDLDYLALKNLINVSIKYNLDGIIATNTTINKKVFFNKPNDIPDGGISGKLLQKKSNEILAKVKIYSKNKLQVIGLGGVEDGFTAYEKLQLGATAIQIYTGLIFNGPNIIEQILSELSDIIKSHNK